MSLRDWLIVIGVVVVVGILADGFRRARRNRRDSLALDQSLSQHLQSGSNRFDPLEPNPELPNGGARPARREPVLADADPTWDEEPVFAEDPVVQDTCAPELAAALAERAPRTASPEPDDVDEPMDTPLPEVAARPEPRPEIDAAPAVLEVPMLVPEREERRPAKESAPRRPSFGFKRAPAKEPVAQEAVAETRAEVVESERLADRPAAEEVLVINLICAPDAPFQGGPLLQALMACDMKFGEMNIFHRFEQSGGRGKVMFSMANGVEPGCFDLEQIDSMETPAISFFMGLPGPSAPKEAFEQMLQTVEYLRQQLGGQLQDEHHSVMRKQTLEHCRQRVSEFERRRLTQRRTAH